jgi:UDP-N-acetyl-2-amino-2-deoxyglucuronate dehydrogenase
MESTKMKTTVDTPTLNVAIIGLGHLHPKGYMPLFEQCPNTVVVAAFDKDETLLSSFCKEFGVKGYADLDELLDIEKIDIAAVFLPHCDCADAAVKCADKGIHLLVEKPIARTVDEVRAVAEAVKRNNVKITTGYCWRYHPVVKAMKDCIEQGFIGSIVTVEARLAAGRVDRYIKGNAKWMLEKAKSGGGPMYNLGVHWIDLLCHLLNDTIEEVCAVNTKTSDVYDVEDSSIALLKFGKGAVGVLSTSYIVPDCFPNGRDLYIGIKGTKGVLSYAPKYEGEQGSSTAGQTDILELYSDSEHVSGSSARKFVFTLDRFSGYSGYMGKAYVDDFVDSIIKDREPFITISQAIDILNVVDAIYTSDQKKSWVKVLKQGP